MLAVCSSKLSTQLLSWLCVLRQHGLLSPNRCRSLHYLQGTIIINVLLGIVLASIERVRLAVTRHAAWVLPNGLHATLCATLCSCIICELAPFCSRGCCIAQASQNEGMKMLLNQVCVPSCASCLL